MQRSDVYCSYLFFLKDFYKSPVKCDLSSYSYFSVGNHPEYIKFFLSNAEEQSSEKLNISKRWQPLIHLHEKNFNAQ